MPHECDTNLTLQHTKIITETESRSKSNTKRLDNVELMLYEIHEMNTNIRLLASQMLEQGKRMEELTTVTREHDATIDEIREKMETKEGIQRLHNRFDVFDAKLDDHTKAVDKQLGDHTKSVDKQLGDVALRVSQLESKDAVTALTILDKAKWYIGTLIFLWAVSKLLPFLQGVM